ncbi:MAG: acetylglutamate kinase [Atopococcus tabaci]|uniref:Acetylglutamate kinase n=1 Tax=Atopococcus tabaci TaxID=269774 RepID=A0AA43UC58_9LACT|nr:acetylglutamate kinase [Atopococcus tabaci]
MVHSEKVEVLIEALPYVNRFYKQIIVIKYGGNAMTSEELKEAVLYDILLMKSVGMLPIIVHGGGPFISDMLGKLEIESEFVDGIRVTTEEAMEVVEMVLAGSVNNDIVKKFNHIGGRAIGISGMDDQFLKVKKAQSDSADYGYVGEIEDIEVDLIRQLIESDYVPVISSVGMGEDGKSYNINADTVASAIAGKIEADKFMLLTDIEGVLLDRNDPDSLVSHLSKKEAEDLIAQGIISGGMIPKVECCLDAIKQGVRAAHIIDGRMKHSLLLELFFDMGIGTMITNEKEKAHAD